MSWAEKRSSRRRRPRSHRRSRKKCREWSSEQLKEKELKTQLAPKQHSMDSVRGAAVTRTESDREGRMTVGRIG